MSRRLRLNIRFSLSLEFSFSLSPHLSLTIMSMIKETERATLIHDDHTNQNHHKTNHASPQTKTHWTRPPQSRFGTRRCGLPCSQTKCHGRNRNMSPEGPWCFPGAFFFGMKTVGPLLNAAEGAAGGNGGGSRLPT